MDKISTPSTLTTNQPVFHERHNSCKPAQATIEFLRQFARVYMPAPAGTLPAGGVILN